MSARLLELQLFHLRMPFRRKFSHARAQRDITDTVVVAALLSDGSVGYGEGLPREYVTGETVESVLYNINAALVDCLQKVEPKNFTELIEIVYNLPFANEQGQIINSARCAVELALLDAYGRHFNCTFESLPGYLGLTGESYQEPNRNIRVSGLLDGSDPDKTLKRLKLMRLAGIKDFKLKLGCQYDIRNLSNIFKRLGRRLVSEKLSLRVDANGAWDIDAAAAMSEKLADYWVCCLEQPLAVDDFSHWNALADLSPVPLMPDESLLSIEDADFFIENELCEYFNIRISKNGGLIPSLRIAQTASANSIAYSLGAMVGETGILAAAGIQFLQLAPYTEFTEICYSTFLLQDDIVTPSIKFGFAGKIPKLSKPGLGISVKNDLLNKYLVNPPHKLTLA